MRKEEKLKQASEYPMRINKYLAHRGYATRRAADDLIASGSVYINGQLAVLGAKVQATDNVEVKRKGPPLKYVYFAYNKPVGVITHSPGEGETDIQTSIAGGKIPKDVFPIGRLDKNSHGVILLTNDGRVTDRLLNPEYDHEKEYVVKTTRHLRDSFKKHMESGVKIDDDFTKKCKVTILGENEFKVVLTEGKKHQIRRMVVALHNDVASLRRTRVMNIKLGSLKPGEYREIGGEELKTFLESLGL